MTTHKVSDEDMAKRIASIVHDHGGQTYYVGGYCRDKIRNVSNKDIDIEVYGITVDQLRRILDTLGTRQEHGKSFGVFGLHGYDIDISLPRKERCTGISHTDFDVTVDPFMSTLEAARRRDLTMNSIMIDVLTEEVIDHFHGVADIKNNVIRHIDDTTFVEDALRVLRVAQFAARFNMKVAPETVELCKSMDIKNLSKERVYGELEKALTKSIVPSTFFDVLREMGHLSYWFFEVYQLIGVPQNEKYHPEGDVYNHTMKVLDYVKTLNNSDYTVMALCLAAICHDMGKLLTTRRDKSGDVHAYDHELYGHTLAQTFLSRFTNDKKLIEYVCNLTRLHMTPHKYFLNNSKVKKTNRMFDDCLYPKDLIRLAYCDVLGKCDYYSAKLEGNWLMDRYNIYTDTMSKPYVQGRDLVECGLKPGPYFSELLSFAHKLRLAGIDKEDCLHQVLQRGRKFSKQFGA